MEEIVRGYEFEKGDYIVMNDEELEALTPERTKTINIISFFSISEVDPIFFDKPYYLEPSKGAEKPYSLLFEVLKQTKKAALGKMILRKKEHLVLLTNHGSGLMVVQLRYFDEIADIMQLNLPKIQKLEATEVELAKALIEKLSKQFNPEEYSDTYTQELERIIQEKAEGKVPTVRGTAPEPTKVRDLMEALKQSLEKVSRE